MTVARSYAWCRKVARTRARNFYYSFLLLSRAQHDAMCAVYAFMRCSDDLSDAAAPETRGRPVTVEGMRRWSQNLERALAGDLPDHPVWPAFHDAVARFHIPHQYFRDMIDGMTQDLDPRPVQTFEELWQYCYRVASVVGLTVIHIMGFDSPEALPLAERCGVAFQLTNILRDVREDVELGRSYLPAEDLLRFGVDLRALRHDGPFVELMRFEAARARRLFEESMPLIGMVDARSRPSLWALIQIYYRLLQRIEQSGFDVLRHRISVPAWEKLWILARALAFR